MKYASYFEKKEQSSMSLVVSRSNVHFGCTRRVIACPIGCASNIGCPKNLVRKNKFFQLYFPQGDSIFWSKFSYQNDTGATAFILT